MPTKRVNKAATAIQSLEKQLAKLQQAAQKARSSQIAKLEKNNASLTKKLAQAKLKLKGYAGKKTPAALRQREAIKDKIQTLSTDLKASKLTLASAKAALKQAQALEKVAKQAQREYIAKLKKKRKPASTPAATLKKKKVKKVLKRASQSADQLTPDLSLPVDASSGDTARKKTSAKKKPLKKTWKPTQKEKTEKATKSTNTETQKSKDKPKKVKTKKTPAIDKTGLASTSNPVLVPVKAEKSAASDTVNETEKTEATQLNTADLKSTQAEEDKPTAKLSPDTDTKTKDEDTDKSADKKEEKAQEEPKPVTNWHTMPLLKKQDD